MQAGDKWVNTMVDFHAPAGCKLWCASVSSSAGQVAMPINVRTVLYDDSGQRVLESDKPQSRVRNYKGNFYQLYEENSEERKYRLHICMREDSGICLDMQTILSNLPVGMEEQLKNNGIPEGESGLPPFLHPIYQMDIIDQDPDAATLQTGMSTSANPLHWWLHIRHVLEAFGVGGVLAAIVLGIPILIAIIIKIMRKGGDIDAIRKELQNQMNRKLSWGNAPAGTQGVYQKVEIEQYKACKDPESYYTVDRDVLEFYREKIFEGNNGNVSAQTLKMIEGNQIKNEKSLIVDVGGEGCFYESCINAGYMGALNFNGKYNNSQKKDKAIPMLIHFQDWNKQPFPLKEGIVDIFMMQSTGTPTFNQACEMIRCLRKGKGSRMDFWVTSDEGKACYMAMAEALQKYAEKGCTVLCKEWSETDVEEVYGYTYHEFYLEKGKVFSIFIQ